MAMRMSMTGQMRMEQRMKLAPRMIQSMEVLQLPLLALQEKIEAELNSNPVLELAEDHDQAAADSTDPSVEMPAEKLLVQEDSDNIEDFQRLESIGEDLTNIFFDQDRSKRLYDASSRTARWKRCKYRRGRQITA